MKEGLGPWGWPYACLRQCCGLKYVERATILLALSGVDQGPRFIMLAVCRINMQYASRRPGRKGGLKWTARRLVSSGTRPAMFPQGDPRRLCRSYLTKFCVPLAQRPGGIPLWKRFHHLTSWQTPLSFAHCKAHLLRQLAT